MHPIRTARLLLRPFAPADAAGMFALDSDPAVHRYLGGIGGPLAATLADSAAVVARLQAQHVAGELGRWVVALAATGEFMGWAGLKMVTGPVNGQRAFCDLGYRLRPAFWGQDYGTEAATAWLARGFGELALPRICAYADVRNAGSCRILEKIGLRPGGEFDEAGVRCRWFEAGRPELKS